jgi:hypothetical protein
MIFFPEDGSTAEFGNVVLHKKIRLLTESKKRNIVSESYYRQSPTELNKNQYPGILSLVAESDNLQTCSWSCTYPAFVELQL